MHTIHSTRPSWCGDQQFTTTFDDPWTAHALPAGIRAEATGMTRQNFTDTFAPTGSIRLGAFSVAPARGDLVECQATLAVADEIMSLHATASGPIGAMTSMLYEIGAPVAIVALHQRLAVDGQTTTYLLCEDDNRQCWAYGTGDTGDMANVNALIAGANRLRLTHT